MPATQHLAIRQINIPFAQKNVAMPLDPQDLGDLIAIRDTGTLSAAAKARGVAVSTVSRRIEALEVQKKAVADFARMGAEAAVKEGKGFDLAQARAAWSAVGEGNACQHQRSTRQQRGVQRFG